ncbi:MAG: hypothetical protein EOR51_29995 [Mesorhizobium sp.]|nr:MAG: hypothetical protein EOR51_29995 [Mesorhizobium sp.]
MADKMGRAKQLNPVDPAHERIAKKLKGFTPDFPEGLDLWLMSSSRPETKAFPVPDLVLFLLRNLMGWPWQGPGEKKRWTVFGSIDGEPVGFELRKFGFTILRSTDPKVPQSRIVGQMQSALKEVERLLEPYAEAQVNQGEVLIVNRFSEFEARYRFFRNLADQAYAKAKKPPRRRRAKGGIVGETGGLVDQLNHVASASREGFFHSTAMVDSYFSALEHRLVLLRAFTGKPLKRGELLEIMGSKWDDKLKAIVPVVGDKQGELLLGRMRRIKERVRNPFAHGGVENDGGSLFFHLPHIGAIPANFSRFSDSVRFSFLPIEADDHSETCVAFDELDAMLSQGALVGPHRLVDAGVDPSFDSETLKRYAAAVAGGAAELERFIRVWGHEWECHANMDY